MAGQKISSLTPVSELQAADQLPLARNGNTYKITGDKFASRSLIDGLSATSDNKFALKTTVVGMSAYTDTKFIVKPSFAYPQQVLTYSGSTNTWVASAGFALPVGTDGQILTYSGSRGAWVATTTSSALPTGSNGQVLTYNSSTQTWVASASLPVGSSGQVLAYNGSTNTWVASAGFSLPTGTGGQFLVYSGSTNTWAPSSVSISLPAGTSGQVLTYNGSTSTWTPSASLPPGTAQQVLTYNGSTNTWVASATPSVINSFTGSNQLLATSGYQRLPGGLILQWGLATNGTITFPIAFPNACFMAVASKNSSTSYDTVACNTFTKTTFILSFYPNGSQNNNPWLAIGY